MNTNQLMPCLVDVKPTNVLIDRKGYVKLCDFGVSGQLDRSIAKTNIGCQSYMAVRSPLSPASCLPPSFLSARSPTNSSPLPTARTNQGRIPRFLHLLHRFFRRLVPRSLNHRIRNRALPLPPGDVLQRLCSTHRDRAW